MINPTISIIIPIYNVEPFIKKCLQSVLNQTHGGFEAILVNDGSTDNSVAIAEDIVAGDSRFILVHQENRGLSAARNTGLKRVSGNFVFYLDSDDVLVTNALELLYKAAQQHRADVVQGNFYYDYPDYLLLNNQQKKAEIICNRNEAMQALLEHKTVLNFAWGKLIATDLAKRHEFPEGKFFEDTYWKAKIVHDCRTYVALKEPVLYYLQRSGGISGGFSIRNLDQLEAEVERLHFLEENYPPSYVQQALKLLYLKFQQHSELLQYLKKEDAEKYRQKLIEFQGQFYFRLRSSTTPQTAFQKLSLIPGKIFHRLLAVSDWKKIRKGNA